MAAKSRSGMAYRRNGGVKTAGENGEISAMKTLESNLSIENISKIAHRRNGGSGSHQRKRQSAKWR
jgi:hypothetical protein